MGSGIGRLVTAVFLISTTSCAQDAANPATRKPSVKEAEAELVKMFSDSVGKAEFNCIAGGSRYDYICDGRYVPFDRTDRVVAHRIGANLSHYFEDKPVFAISVIRDSAKK